MAMGLTIVMTTAPIIPMGPTEVPVQVALPEIPVYTQANVALWLRESVLSLLVQVVTPEY